MVQRNQLNNIKHPSLPILLNEAISQIPKKWQEKESPKIRDWIFCVNEIYNIESLDDRGVEPEEELERKDKWEKWQAFKKTWRYVEDITR